MQVVEDMCALTRNRLSAAVDLGLHSPCKLGLSPLECLLPCGKLIEVPANIHSMGSTGHHHLQMRVVDVAGKVTDDDVRGVAEEQPHDGLDFWESGMPLLFASTPGLCPKKWSVGV